MLLSTQSDWHRIKVHLISAKSLAVNSIVHSFYLCVWCRFYRGSVLQRGADEKPGAATVWAVHRPVPDRWWGETRAPQVVRELIWPSLASYTTATEILSKSADSFIWSSLPAVVFMRMSQWCLRVDGEHQGSKAEFYEACLTLIIYRLCIKNAVGLQWHKKVTKYMF